MANRHHVTTLDELPPGSGKAFKIAGHEIALFNIGGTVHAIDDICPHAGASLANGPLKGGIVCCPWHYAAFDVATGKSQCKGAFSDVRSFKVHQTGKSIEVEV